MKKIEGFLGVAPNLSETGSLEYCLWVDDSGALYVQIVKNTGHGKHSKLLFRVSDFIKEAGIDIRTPIPGRNPDSFKEESSSITNDTGFLKAVIKHLLPVVSGT
jgi:hypothetical protein